MRRWRPHRIGGRLTSAAAAAILLVIIGSVALFSSTLTRTSGSFESSGDNAVRRAAYDSLTVGSSREDVEDQIGQGKDALDFLVHTGLALEPIDADCTYYPQAGTGNYRDIIQLCFRNDRLVRKRTYPATPGAPIR